MDITALLHSVPQTENDRLYLLLEGGAQTSECFQAFFAMHSSFMHSLFLHPQLAEAKDYGPWLLAVEHKDELDEYIKNTPGIVGFIISPCLLSSLAIQLANGCTVICPDNSTALTRFYARPVVSVFAQCTGQEWHTFLFKDIVQWWTPAGDMWLPITIMASNVENARDHTIRLDENTWRQIADKPEISSVLTQWQKMPISQHFPPCTLRDMVIKALGKALAAGMTTGADRKLYALYYLNGGKQHLESEAMQVSFERINRQEISLQQVLLSTQVNRGN